MSIHLDAAIEEGWDVFARDGSRVGTVAGVEAEQLRIAFDDGDAQRTVPRNLVIEAHAGRVELDMPPEELGVHGVTAGPAAPTRDPGAPPRTATPEQMRRLTGG